MKSPEELLKSYREQAESALTWAQTHHAAKNWPILVSNYTSAARSHFTRALIGWRTGLIDPMPDLDAALAATTAGVDVIRTVDVGPYRYQLDPGPAAYCAVLLDRRSSPVIEEMARALAPDAPRAAVYPVHRLDAWLVSALTGGPGGAGPGIAATLARKSNPWAEASGLCFELLALPHQNSTMVWDLTHRIVALFSKRRRFDAGFGYEGSTFYNDVVVDYRLAAVWCVGGWDPSGLSAVERLHALLP
jgi:hypothetical protein